MIDDRTPHLNLPLPARDNALEEDVVRLRDALNAIDEKFASLDTLLESDDETLDALQELVNAIKENRDDIMDLLTEQEEVVVLEEDQTQIDLVELSGTAGCAVFIEGIRLNKNEWSRDSDVSTRLHLSKTYPAGHVVTVVRRQGGV